MLNTAPKITGKTVLLRKPKESDVLDYFNIETSPELIRMYGGNTQAISSSHLKRHRRLSNPSNQINWNGMSNLEEEWLDKQG